MAFYRTSLLRSGGRSQSPGGRCNRKLGNDWGTNLQQSFGVPTAALDIRAQTQPALNDNAGYDRDSFSLCVRHYCLPLGTPAIEPGSTPLC
jgi:hypothetical protein